MPPMRRIGLPLAATAALLAAVAVGPAAARIFELGQTAAGVSAPPPCNTVGKTTTCPSGISPGNYGIILPHVTALETLRDGSSYPTTAPRDGRIVAFTVGLSALDRNRTMRHDEIKTEDQRFGNLTTRVQLVVLRAVGKRRKRMWRAVQEGPVVHVQPYLGLVVQIPLETTVPVARGDVIALTTPSWAPVLTIKQDTRRYAYRQSRTKNCANPPVFSQAQALNQVAAYGCDYPGTRIEYSATEVTTMPYPKNYVRARDVGSAAARALPQVISIGTNGARMLPTGGVGL